MDANAGAEPVAARAQAAEVYTGVLYERLRLPEAARAGPRAC